MIIIKNLTKKYKKNTIFENLNYKFENGVYQIIGKNGRGKSVFLRMITQVEKPTAGNVINDQDDLPTLYLANTGIGLPFMSINDNIQLSAKILNIPIEEKEYAKIFDNEEELLRSPYESSSLGNQMKVGLSLLFSEAKFGLIVLDEALNGLDETSKSQILKQLKKLSENTTIMIVSHNNIFNKDEIKYFSLDDTLGDNFDR